MLADECRALEKDNVEQAAAQLNPEEIAQLVEFLSSKDDNLRYNAFLLLQCRSRQDDSVYPHWDILLGKLKSENSYQRSLGVMLLAENAKWDAGQKMADALEECLAILVDEKPITVRQGIQSLAKIAQAVPAVRATIADRLMQLDLTAVRETMRKLILMDILSALILVKKESPDPKIEAYLVRALTGDILDKKSKKTIEILL